MVEKIEKVETEATETATDTPAVKKAPVKKATTAKKTVKEAVAVETVKKPRAKKTETADSASEDTGLKALKAAKATTQKAAAPKKEKSATDSKGRTYATGKRKTSIARVWIMPGTGKIQVNGKDFEAYFRRPILKMMINQPFGVANRVGAYDVMATIKGGGLSGQAGALKHGISKALVLADSELRAAIKQAGFLTRDSRVVERKHYGHKKARRSFQFSKR